jgi:hypothetical protein
MLPTLPPHALVLDACILMSGLLRPLLLELAKKGLLSPVWNDRIGLEWQRNATRMWPLSAELLANEWAKMQAEFPMANMGDVSGVETEFVHCDKKDRHVAAAGMLAARDHHYPDVTVLTWNTKDFSRSELRRHQIGLSDPDLLLSRWWPTHSNVIGESLTAVIQDLFASGRRQPESMVDMIRRDRLYRLAKLYERDVQADTV